MNKMKDVAALLGVQLNKEFQVCDLDDNQPIIDKFKITETGLVPVSNVVYNPEGTNELLMALIRGDIKLIKSPFKPGYRESYWSIFWEQGTECVCHYIWIDTLINYLHYYHGLCFRTKEEAEANKDKLIKIINHYKED